MKVLFMSLANFDSLQVHGIYSDLLMEFINHGDEVYVLSPIERRNAETAREFNDNGAMIAKVRILNMQKTNFVEKGLSMLTIDHLFKKGIKKYFANVKFDLVLYPTPPITLTESIKYIKKRDSAKTYLLLKDIFPQNAIDIGIMNPGSVLYRYFRKKEKCLYELSDHIGCMSPANKEYLLKHNEEINPDKVGVCPNSIKVVPYEKDEGGKRQIREKYGLPQDKRVFVYGGNLGKPQGIPFLIQCLEASKDLDCFFVVIGNGTEYRKIEEYINSSGQNNAMLMKSLPKEDYDRLVTACDVGMIFLDHRFTIPNFPSRILSYMQAKLPILAVTDPSTDVGRIITEANCGWWCESNDADKVKARIEEIIGIETDAYGDNGYAYLSENYSVESAWRAIMDSMEKH